VAKVIARSPSIDQFCGSLGEVYGENIVKTQQLAIKTSHPVIDINDGAGARVQEGVDCIGEPRCVTNSPRRRLWVHLAFRFSCCWTTSLRWYRCRNARDEQCHPFVVSNTQGCSDPEIMQLGECQSLFMNSF
jgi:hypothetical protein